VTRTLDHTQASEMFSAYLDGELSAEDAQALEAHLASCDKCRGELETFKKIVGAAKGLHKMAAPQDLVRGVTSRIEKRSRGLFFHRKKRRPPYEMFSLLMLAVLLVVYIILKIAQPAILNMR
jgi:anti-sigma factor RsiW